MTKTGTRDIRDDLPKVKPIDVDVFATKVAGDGYDYKLEIKTHGHDDNGKLKTPKDEGCAIRFNLVRKSKEEDVRFDASAPFSVRRIDGSDCQSLKDCEQIIVDSCTADELVIIDWNFGHEMELEYELHFTSFSGLESVRSCDPVIQNTGGGIKPS